MVFRISMLYLVWISQNFLWNGNYNIEFFKKPFRSYTYCASHVIYGRQTNVILQKISFDFSNVWRIILNLVQINMLLSIFSHMDSEFWNGKKSKCQRTAGIYFNERNILNILCQSRGCFNFFCLPRRNRNKKFT